MPKIDIEKLDCLNNSQKLLYSCLSFKKTTNVGISVVLESKGLKRQNNTIAKDLSFLMKFSEQGLLPYNVMSERVPGKNVSWYWLSKSIEYEEAQKRKKALSIVAAYPDGHPDKVKTYQMYGLEPVGVNKFFSGGCSLCAI